MNLTPLYDLRDRLKTGAVAGTGLITEDFRLTRALEAFAPFETASPVFAKLGQSVRNMLSPECQNRAEALLDALSLCDAVLTTQAVTLAEGDIEPLPAAVGSIFSNAPYSVLSPLLDALTTSGSGKYSTVIDTHSQNPQLFADYRVKHGMVTALGASYAELAEQVAEWLYDEGTEIIPLLKQGFDPNGKKEMVRRVQVIDRIAKASENDFYISLLENSEKDIKAAAIYALRHSEENAELLVGLAKTEKGNAKKMAHWAMAQLESGLVWDYWNKLFAKNPDSAAEYMTLSSTEKSGAMIGKTLLDALEAFKNPETAQNKESYQTLRKLMYALPGKSGAEICSYYERAAEFGNTLDKPLPELKKPYYFCRGEGYYTSEAYLFSAFIPVILTSSIIFNPTSDLIALAHRLFQKYGYTYSLPMFASNLITKNSDEAYKSAEKLLNPGFRLTGLKNEEKEALKSLQWLLEQLKWKNGAAIPEFSLYFHNPSIGSDTMFSQGLAAPLDKRWYIDAAKPQNEFTSFLMRDSWPQDNDVRQIISKYFFDICRKKHDNHQYMSVLTKLGWTEYNGFFKKYCESKKDIDYWTVTSYLKDLPVSNEEKISELEWLLKKIEEKKIKVRGSHHMGYLQDTLKQYREASAAPSGN